MQSPLVQENRKSAVGTTEMHSSKISFLAPTACSKCGSTEWKVLVISGNSRDSATLVKNQAPNFHSKCRATIIISLE